MPSPPHIEAQATAVSTVTVLWVFLAGGLGASLRFLLSRGIDARFAADFAHVGTLGVNLAGCLAIGFLGHALAPGQVRHALIGGMLGGFTTYSAFALFTVSLAAEGRYAVLGAQLGLHLLGGVACVLVGAQLARLIVN